MADPLETNIDIPLSELREFSERWNVRSIALFGSVLREDFDADSDIDILLSFRPHSNADLIDLVNMRAELENLFRRRVDIVERDALVNPYRRAEILNSARTIYAA
jgi:uncharacterized protein